MNRNLEIIKEALTLAGTYQSHMDKIFQAHYGTSENYNMKLMRRNFLELGGCTSEMEVNELNNLRTLHDRFHKEYQLVFEMYNATIMRIKEAAFRL